jgi:hypothetical protein
MPRLLLAPVPLLATILALACASGGGSSSSSELDDLIGARGSAGESQMQARGYTAVGGDVEGSTKVSYWRRTRDGRCVSVRTADGRYQAIAPATPQDCERAEGATQAVAAPDPGGYRTVCGVMVGTRPVEYVCSVEGGDQRSRPTTLRFPDMVMVLHWLPGNRVRVELEGAAPIEGTWSESEGETDIVTPEKTWFYISDRGLAESRVKSE